MIIDSYEAIIVYLLGQAALTTLVGTRIAVKHQYGSSGGWTSDQVGLVVAPNGGDPDLYLPTANIAGQFRIYANSVQEGLQIWRALVGISRATSREVVTVTGGDGLIYWLNLRTSPALITDYELDKDILLVNFSALVGENANPA